MKTLQCPICRNIRNTGFRAPVSCCGVDMVDYDPKAVKALKQALRGFKRVTEDKG